MGLSSDLERRIKDKIDELEKQKKILQEELSKEEDFTSYATSTYGSELASDVFNKENKLRADIRLVEANIIALRQVLDGGVDISETTVARLEDRISNHNQNIENLKVQIKWLEYERAYDTKLLDFIRSVKELPGLGSLKGPSD